jgi:parvulin-like peptidyl-prolyl isomerase
MTMFSLSMKRWTLFSLWIILFFSLRCKDRILPENSQEFDLSDPEKRIHIILRIGESFYFNSDFEKQLELLVGEDYKTLDVVSLSRLLDDFIESKLFLAAARDMNLTVSPEEQKQYLAKLPGQSLADRENGVSTEFETQALLERLMIEKYTFLVVSDIEVGEDEIQNYYETNKREYLRPERVAVSQILLDTEEKAVDILERIQNSSEEDFRKLAREVSAGIEAEKGGVMGIFEMNQLPREMEKVVFSMKEGEISQVVESAYGFHIFRLDKKFEPVLEPLEAVAEKIRIFIMDNAVRLALGQHLNELKQTKDWEFYPNNLSFPYQRNNNE